MNKTILYGVEPVLRALEGCRQVHEIMLSETVRNARLHKLRALAEERGCHVVTQPRAVLDKRVQANHQGVIAVVDPLPPFSEQMLYDSVERLDTPKLLLLDQVQDPHNLGACLRSANAFGVDFVVAPKDNAASINATVSKVACGAAELTPFVQVTNLSRCIETLKQLGVWVVGTSADAATAIHEASLPDAYALVVGNEGKGLRHQTEKKCDLLVHIPMTGMVESLNVSVATGICLYALSI